MVYIIKGGLKMNEFSSIEMVRNIFTSVGAQIVSNDFFIAFKDMRKNTGMVGGMDYPYDAIIINFSDEGLNFLYLKQDGVVFKQNLSKMHIDKSSYEFISMDDIENITIKNFALLNNKTKKIIIKTKNKKTHYLYANLNEQMIPYHNVSFEKFINKYSK